MIAGDFEDIQYLNKKIKHLQIEEEKDEDVVDGQSSNLESKLGKMRLGGSKAPEDEVGKKAEEPDENHDMGLEDRDP